ncbi:hypothetical protein OLL83_003848 [Shewanella algae]|uniref:hypothetical protein n=1 Tax=Shewanella algae TaxID=38313 RepID=UPI00222FB35E|nr:hypothetical protein [Shewanella algae]UZD58007.1 hypothetical protein OLL83_003848 [Shewanella algae]
MSYMYKLVDSLGSFVEIWPSEKILHKVKRKQIGLKCNPKDLTTDSAWLNTAEELSRAFLNISHDNWNDVLADHSFDDSDDKTKSINKEKIQLLTSKYKKHYEVLITFINSEDSKNITVDELINSNVSEIAEYIKDDVNLFDAVSFNGKVRENDEPRKEQSGNRRFATICE